MKPSSKLGLCIGAFINLLISCIFGYKYIYQLAIYILLNGLVLLFCLIMLLWKDHKHDLEKKACNILLLVTKGCVVVSYFLLLSNTFTLRVGEVACENCNVVSSTGKTFAIIYFIGNFFF
ncbi:hypothetical protein EDEG_00453, partial [Edhazardia aedis USNM 41457]